MIRLSGTTDVAYGSAAGFTRTGPTQSKRYANGVQRSLLVGAGIVALIAILFNAFVTWLGKENWTMLPI